jgi:hypothetical protein
MSEALWRDIRDIVREEIAASHKTQRIEPNTPFGSVVCDPYGHIVHGAAGGGSGMALLAYHPMSASQSVSGSAYVQYDLATLSFAVNVGSCVDDSSGHWTFTAPSSNYHLFYAATRYQSTASGWSAGNEAHLFLYLNGGPSSYLDMMEPANNTQNNRLRGWAVVYCAAGDTVEIRTTQNSGTNKTLVSGFGEYVMVVNTGVS